MVQIHSFSTSRAPEANRALMFQREMASLFSVGLEIRCSVDRPLSTELRAFRSRQLNFASLRFSPHSTTMASRRDDAPARILVTMQKEGVATVSQGGRDSRIEAGHIFLIDLTKPFEIETGEILTHSMYLDPTRLLELMPQAESLTALPVDSRSGPGAIFRAMFDELFTLAPSLDDGMADRIADMLPYGLAVALSSLRQAEEALPSRFKLLHRQRVQRYAREHLHERGLNVTSISRALKLSERYIYDLFCEQSETLMKWIWSERLEHCYRELAMPALLTRSIGEIAYSWGFSDVAHFSRTFRQRYGTSPREHRKRAHGRTGVSSRSSCLE